MIGTPPIPEGFWRKAAASESPVLILDYDGTLAPFCDDPSRAVPYPGVRELLIRISRSRTRVAVVSGRPAREIFGLLDTPGIDLWGEHGGERFRDGASVFLFPPGAEQETLFAKAVEMAQRESPGVRLARKRLSLAAHARGVPEGERRLDVLERVWRSLLGERREEISLQRFDGGIELRPQRVGKALAVSEILSGTGKDDAVAYLGDDFTDEDAFLALGARGLAVLVRKEPRPTAARHRIVPPEELLLFLGRWAASVEGGGPE